MSVASARTEFCFQICDCLDEGLLAEPRFENLPIVYEKLYHDYQNEYHSKNGSETKVRFLKIALGSRLVGLACIVDSSLDDSGLELHTPRLELTQTVFDPRVSPTQRAEAIGNAAEYLSAIRSEWRGKASITVSQKLSDQTTKLLLRAGGFRATGIIAEMRVDLTKSEGDLFASLRKKHRQQIRKYSDLVRVAVRTDTEALHELQRLHFRVAGRITRSPLTWKIQEEAVLEGLAFVVTVRNLSDELLGALYVMYSNYDAISFSAAYDRSAMREGYPLGHICEWQAIEYLAMNRLAQSYLLGGAERTTTKDAKLASINSFKDGFSPTYQLIGQLTYVG